MSASSLAGLAARAVERARATRGPVLVSVAERVDDLDPLAALEHAAAADPGIDRTYWTRPADRFELAALGAAATFAPDEPDRFGAVERGWRALLEDAVIEDGAGGTPGVGPLLVGGFSFDPDGPRTRRWLGFPRARLVLPRLHLAAVDGACWLTTSLVVHPGDDVDAELTALAHLRARLLEAPRAADDAPAPLASAEPLAMAEARPADDWRTAVADAVEAIRAGAMEKVVLAREVRASGDAAFDVGAALRALRAAYADCYVFAFWRGDAAFVGASPERLVRVDGRRVRASSLAGSIRRGATPDDDAALVRQLRDSAKDRVEHAVVLDALRGALADLCDDVESAPEPDVLTLAQIHHLHTSVRARLRDGRSILDLAERLHPTPAVGGQPRGAALRFLRDHERLDRGWYAAPVGWFGRDAGEFAVGLRSALVSGAEASLYAGCGIVADSDADREYAESALKLRPMEQALARAQDGAAPVPVPAREGAA